MNLFPTFILHIVVPIAAALAVKFSGISSENVAVIGLAASILALTAGVFAEEWMSRLKAVELSAVIFYSIISVQTNLVWWVDGIVIVAAWIGFFSGLVLSPRWAIYLAAYLAPSLALIIAQWTQLSALMRTLPSGL